MKTASNKKSRPHRLNIPKTFQIGVHTIEVDVKDLSKEGCYGRYLGKFIELDERMLASDDEMSLDTYFHEMLHAICDLRGYQIPHEQIQVMGTDLAQALLSAQGTIK